MPTERCRRTRTARVALGLILALAVSVPAALVSPAAALAADPPPAGYGQVVAKLLPTVVSIYVRTPVEKNVEGNGPARLASKASQGSGFVVDPSGYIVTNRHVIEGAYEITVVTEDQRYLKARLVGKMPRMDLALLKVENMTPMQAVAFGDSSKMASGDAVIAIGNPLGLGGTVTTGVVSALNRNISETPFDDYIQTDAAINHGNSGGPLFNAQGELIGVNTAFFSPDGGSGSVGLSFAIPSNDVAWIIDQMRKHHAVRAGWVDLQTQDVGSALAAAFHRADPGGAIVVGLRPDGVAAKAGMKRGDIILSFNDQTVTDVRALARAAGMTAPGQTVPVQVWRAGATTTLMVPVVEYIGPGGVNGIMMAPPSDGSIEQGMKAAHLGLTLAPLTDATRRKFGLAADQTGVLIDAVAPFSIAEVHELRAGEVITDVGDAPVSSVDQVAGALSAMMGNGAPYVPLLVTRGDETRWVPLPVANGVP